MRNFTPFFALLFFPFQMFATDCLPDCDCETDWTLEVRGAYYYLPDRALKKVYTPHWMDYEVETAKRVHDFIEVWGGVSWASRKGHGHRIYRHEDLRERTTLFLLPISLGLKVIYPILPCLDVYLGAGISYSFLKIKYFCREHFFQEELSRSSLKKAIYKNEFGGLFKVGCQWAMSDSTFLDFFVDYQGQRFRLSHKDHRRNLFSHPLDCSGFKFGAGCGVYF